MSEPISSTAWLERPPGERVPLTGNCSLGRAAGNDVVLEDERISRRHATIHAQGDQEFLLVDLGSRNGTYLNGRRVNQPTRLRDGDRVEIGPFALCFRQASPSQTRGSIPGVIGQTLVEVRSTPCWLMLCDLVGSSTMARQQTAQELAMLVGGWFGRCKELIEDNGGVINKYLGDGLLAYWRAHGESLNQVRQILQQMQQVQDEGALRFRIVVHHGEITIGGVPSSGEDSLSGPDVNLIFRLERLASEMGFIRIASASAVRLLGDSIAAASAGEHALSGFEGTHAVYTFTCTG
jgi:adenylate cyclase